MTSTSRTPRRGGRRRFVALALTLAALAASCGGDDSGSDDPVPTTTGDATNEPAAGTAGVRGDTGGTTETSAPATADDPVTGGDVTVLLSSDSGTLDPAHITAAAGSDGHRIFALYGALALYDANEDAVVPILAESLAPDDTFTTWTLTLQPDLVFSDGTPLDAAAVKFNWEREQDPANRSAAIATLASVTAMNVVDDVTLEIVLDEPYAHFDKAMSRVSTNFIASPTAITSGVDLTSAAVGAGPFLLEEWVRDDRMVLIPNPDWKGSAGPYLDSLTIRVIPDEDQKVDTLTTGDADGLFTSTASSTARVLDEVDGAAATTVRVTTGSVLLFNNSVAPFDDLRVRTAIVQAVNWETLVDAVFGPDATPLHNFTLEGTPWFTPEATLPAFDPDAAQALIDEYVAETGGPVEIPLITSQASTGLATTEFIQTSLSQLDGVSATVDAADTPTFVTAVRNGDYGAAMWGHPMLDAEPGLTFYLRSGSINNFSAYSNPDVDALIDEQRVTADPATRQDLVHQIFAQVAADLPYYPYVENQNSWLMGPQVHDVVVHEDGILRSDLLWRDA